MPRGADTAKVIRIGNINTLALHYSALYYKDDGMGSQV